MPGIFSRPPDVLKKGPSGSVIKNRTQLVSDSNWSVDISNQSLSATGNSARKKFGEARDRGGIFGDASQFPATETALSRVPGGKATES
jgi:hypothetical protein